ncbi:HIRA-interacting protein 3-like isoform X2 [Myxocyprinus asiaticus]|uniref:HIRA-interacting protein 3-like isoform X2 n=1 Tax=Myxocyprinus asiaticus TaxID=70543 RepID=UPI0022237F8D|nr:HIRA-interacting protein 3-like isoform X2 [Myxocyprinus asiaticus]
MVKEEDAIRKFVVKQLQQCSDLSALTLGILRKRYLEQVGRESLNMKDRQSMKKIVEEELLKMQVSSDDEPLVKFVAPPKIESKRKRVDDDGDEGLENKVVGRTKRSRLDETSPDSPDSGIEKAMNEAGQKEEQAGSDHTDEDNEEEQEKKSTMKTVTQQKQNKRGGKQSSKGRDNKKKKKPEKRWNKVESEEEEDDELDDSDEEGGKQNTAKKVEKKKKDEDSASEEETSDKPTKNYSSESVSNSEDERGKSKKMKKRKEIRKKKPLETDAVKEVERQVFGSSSESEDEKNESTKTRKRSSSESEATAESEEEKDKREDAADLSSKEMENNEKKQKLQENQEEEANDSDSSSLPSLEDEEEQEKDKKEGKQKSVTKKKLREEGESATRGKDEENKAVSRLKRYIALCGVRRNYKKLLDGCRSVKAKVAVLKKELEELGVEGQPSIEKCKKARLKREEAQELAELDVSNIIATQGRPKRRAASAVWPPPQNVSPPPFAYKRVVDSDSDSGDSHTNKGHKKATAWGNLQGIISDDGESD